MKRIKIEELRRLVDSGDATIINILPEEVYNFEKIPTSINYSAAEDDFVRNVEEDIPDKTEYIVLYGSEEDENAVKYAHNLLEASGYRNVFLYSDGIEGWKEAGYETIGYAHPAVYSDYEIDPWEEEDEWSDQYATSQYDRLQFRRG